MSRYVPYVTHYDIARPYHYRIRRLVYSTVINMMDIQSRTITKLNQSCCTHVARFEIFLYIIIIIVCSSSSHTFIISNTHCIMHNHFFYYQPILFPSKYMSLSLRVPSCTCFSCYLKCFWTRFMSSTQTCFQLRKPRHCLIPSSLEIWRHIEGSAFTMNFESPTP